MQEQLLQESVVVQEELGRDLVTAVEMAVVAVVVQLEQRELTL
jgi:hypothetical protein